MTLDTRFAIDLAARLLELIDEAQTSTSYKYALLIALIDLCQAHELQGAGATTMLTTRQIAERVIELYWAQTRPHPAKAEPLRQLHGKKSSVVERITAFRKYCGHPGFASPHKTRLADATGYEDLVDEVELVFIRYPIRLLQRIGNQTWELLYKVPWSVQPTEGQIRAYQREVRGLPPKKGGRPQTPLDNRILLLENVGGALSLLANLFRPMIQRKWALFVARCNSDAIGEGDLVTFLFEPRREDLAPVRPHLMDLQGGQCFYCAGNLTSSVDVDHYLPWSRCCDNRLENLVAAHPGCNNSKRDHLAAVSHLARWVPRFDPASPAGQAISSLAETLQWQSARSQTLNLARAIYLQLPEGTLLWKAKDEFEGLQRGDVSALLQHDH